MCVIIILIELKRGRYAQILHWLECISIRYVSLSHGRITITGTIFSNPRSGSRLFEAS